jgi:hypothetical protein
MKLDVETPLDHERDNPLRLSYLDRLGQYTGQAFHPSNGTLNSSEVKT